MGLDPAKPSPAPIDDEPPPNQSLLPSTTAATTALIFSLLLTTCTTLAAAFAFAFLFFSSAAVKPSNHHHAAAAATAALQLARPLAKLTHQTVILISSDGFRFGYQFKTPTPNIHRLIQNGTEAETGLISVFPTLTFPNHYSIATGLYPAYHGIINNKFTNPITNKTFTMSSHEPEWWLGKPIWETIANHGLKPATYFWPGSEGSWDCPQGFCAPYNESVPFEERVDTVLNYFDLPKDEIPVFMTLYFEDPDHQGHLVGPDDPEITEAVKNVDGLIGRLINGLENRGVFEDVTIILVGDHGMVGTCDKRLIFLDDLASWNEIPEEWSGSRDPSAVGSFGFRDRCEDERGFGVGEVNNRDKLRVFRKEDLPERLHYSDSDRIPPIIGLVEEGFKIEQRGSGKAECGGAHGYDNRRKVPSFENVEIYNLITSILGINGASNNGSSSFAKTMILSHDH
ncbi:LOW QUALITY PROTEIN: hypothetical protein OSB04_015254 [Centaurea solstitialis]|uniref:Uncharacterized protein n=1 Tax=Centaurea solstitialis TaxID=347529 RepID=A0AA38WIJ9_9ASTR|nr:LOW QUALITY PROTEIN: hypothetical protein OSB04_015254 [Centaurea solstitialis]